MKQRVLAGLVMVLVITLPALAHAVLPEATPTANGSITGPDINVKLRFNSRIDSARSRLTLVLPDHTLRPVSLQPSTAPAALAARISGLGTGGYTLRWQVLAADGHISRGEIPFQVK